MFDTEKVHKITPEYWRNSQLSVARFYGAAVINGKRYVLDTDTDYLVREDIYKAEQKEKKAAKKAAKKKCAELSQADLF